MTEPEKPVLVKVSVITDPLTDTAVTALATPPVVTVKLVVTGRWLASSDPS